MKKKNARTYKIGACHNAFGFEGMRDYTGTPLGARRAAIKIAHKAGHGWQPEVREQAE